MQCLRRSQGEEQEHAAMSGGRWIYPCVFLWGLHLLYISSLVICFSKVADLTMAPCLGSRGMSSHPVHSAVNGKLIFGSQRWPDMTEKLQLFVCYQIQKYIYLNHAAKAWLTCPPLCCNAGTTQSFHFICQGTVFPKGCASRTHLIFGTREKHIRYSFMASCSFQDHLSLDSMCSPARTCPDQLPRFLDKPSCVLLTYCQSNWASDHVLLSSWTRIRQSRVRENKARVSASPISYHSSSNTCYCLEVYTLQFTLFPTYRLLQTAVF